MQLKHDDIERFIIENIEIISSIDIDDNKDSLLEEDIFESGLVDSFGVVSLIAIIEEKYSITINNFYLNSSKIRNIKGMASIIYKLMSLNNV